MEKSDTPKKPEFDEKTMPKEVGGFADKGKVEPVMRKEWRGEWVTNGKCVDF